MIDGETIQELHMGGNACSVEWCPVTGSQHFLACSTYNLNSTIASHTGEDVVPTRGESTSHGCGVESAAESIGQAKPMADRDAPAPQERSGTIVVHKVGHTFGTNSRYMFILGIYPSLYHFGNRR